jgi:predicted ATP-grasp superfamily ATP-dependent carboligase
LIVEPGRSRGALAGARALRAAGWEIGIGAARGQLSVHSRAVTWRHEIPGADADADRFVHAVAQACQRVPYGLVFAADDAELLALSQWRSRIPAQVPCSSHQAVMRALDRRALAELAHHAGVPAPRTFAPEDPDLPDTALVVKPAVRRHGGVGRTPTSVASGRDEARAAVRRLRDLGEEPILQERLEGPLTALSVVADRGGRIVAAVQQEAHRLFPPGAGMSARAVTVPVDPVLLERVGRLTGELPWFGLAQLQFVVPPGGEPMLIDFNGRFYGSMALAVAAGVNLAALWAGLAAGDPVPQAVALGRPGIHYQWLEGDVRRAVAERRGGLVRDVAGVLRPVRGRIGAVWTRSDPWPAVRYALDVPRRALRRSGG